MVSLLVSSQQVSPLIFSQQVFVLPSIQLFILVSFPLSFALQLLV